MSGLVVAPRATTTALQHSSLKYCVAVFKEEAIAAKVVCEITMHQSIADYTDLICIGLRLYCTKEIETTSLIDFSPWIFKPKSPLNDDFVDRL